MAILTQTADEFRQWLTQKTAEARIPVGMTIELVARCNFRCTHCYMGSLRDNPRQMPYDMICRILSEAASLGCVSVGFTGGEPLLRNDYAQIHEFAHRQGFWISLLTNGFLLTDQLIQQFRCMPPRAVEISLYGGDESHYREITGVHGAFEKVTQNIDKLLHAGIHVSLKSVLLSPVLASIDAMNTFAEARGLEIVYDPAVTPDVLRNTAPTEFRMSPRCAVNIEMASEKSRDASRKKLQFAHSPNPSMPVCGAGHRGFHVDFLGNMQQCVSLRTPSVSLADHTLAQAWDKLGTFPPPIFPPDALCSTCELQPWCSYCPGTAACGDPFPTQKEDFYCQVARARAAAGEKKEKV
ncbi:MAG: radical SAM protein [Deltaproteobacteria bacterium]|nr:radical SAM protein [Deltaproteobacteria bacterium]MBN2674241.1 radical SAM protein [Deltaproteobacteria bacterium]